MEEFKRMVATIVLILLACAGCTGKPGELDANGVPRDLVPAGYDAKDCHFEDVEQGLRAAGPAVGMDQVDGNRTNSPSDGIRWQRLVCHHG